MDSVFSQSESLIRAVRPASQRPSFWNNGKLSSAALKDKRGLSVTRTYDRSVEATVAWMIDNFSGAMFSISVEACNVVRAYLKYCPSQNNSYHCEIHGSATRVMLDDVQALSLARKAKLEYMPNISISI